MTLELRTAGGATAAATRVPAVQVGDAGEWSFVCDLPAGVYKVVGRAYDVAGNRQKAAAVASLRVKGSRAPAGMGARR